MKVECVIEDTPFWEQEGHYLTLKKLDEIFLICNGDTFLDFNIINFINSFKKKKFSSFAQNKTKSIRRFLLKIKIFINFSYNCKNNDLFNTDTQ